jgi:hypothetical protein
VLATRGERTGWSPGMALRYAERFYKLEEILPPPDAGSTRWTYRFGAWPEGEVFRKLVDYDQDSAVRTASQERTLSAKLGRWISGRKE